MRQGRQSRTQILLVEKSPSFARLVRSELINRGFRNVRLAFGTEDALALLTKERFAAVICDTEAPSLGGPAFVRAARTRDDMIDPFVPIIMTSFSPTFRVISDCRDAGANTFLAKPVSNAQLTEKLLISLTEARHFIKAKSYFGPDRRKGERRLYRGWERRGAAATRRAIPYERYFAV